MTKSYWNEEWKDIVFDDNIMEDEKFRISNYGRIMNLKRKEPYIAQPMRTNGYQTIKLFQKSGKRTARYVHRLVAEYFLDGEDRFCVIHLNYDKEDNRASNLKWASKKEKDAHIAAQGKLVISNSKLTESQVIHIKKILQKSVRRTRIKMIARQFGVSEMQIYRIKSGENWSHIKVD